MPPKRPAARRTRTGGKDAGKGKGQGNGDPTRLNEPAELAEYDGRPSWEQTEIDFIAGRLRATYGFPRSAGVAAANRIYRENEDIARDILGEQYSEGSKSTGKGSGADVDRVQLEGCVRHKSLVQVDGYVRRKSLVQAGLLEQIEIPKTTLCEVLKDTSL